MSTPDTSQWRVLPGATTVDFTERMQIPGGFLYRTVLVNQDGTRVVALCFVPTSAVR